VHGEAHTKQIVPSANGARLPPKNKPGQFHIVVKLFAKCGARSQLLATRHRKQSRWKNYPENSQLWASRCPAKTAHGDCRRGSRDLDLPRVRFFAPPTFLV